MSQEQYQNNSEACKSITITSSPDPTTAICLNISFSNWTVTINNSETMSFPTTQANYSEDLYDNIAKRVTGGSCTEWIVVCEKNNGQKITYYKETTSRSLRIVHAQMTRSAEKIKRLRNYTYQSQSQTCHLI